MKTFAKFLSFAATFSLLSASSAMAAPENESCSFLRALSSGDGAKKNAQFEKMISHWDPSAAENVKKTLATFLQGKKFSGGQVYAVANYPTNLVEHLVIMRKDKGGVAFARLQYVWYPDGLKVDYVNFNDFYANIIANQPFATTPTPLNCG